MLLPKPLRRFFSVFRGDLSPVMIILSVLFGFWLGLLPGWSGLHTLILVVVLVFKVNLGVVFLSGALGKALLYAAAPVFFHAGRLLHDVIPALYDLLGTIPVVGLTDYNCYAVAAAVVLGPFGGFVLGLIFCWIVTGFRRVWLNLQTKHEKLVVWQKKWWVRFLSFLLVGKKSKKELNEILTAKPVIVRKIGVVFAVVVLLLSAGGILLLKNDAVRNYATGSLTRLNGAEVDLEALDLQLESGRLAVSGLQFTDAEKPVQNRYEVAKAEGDVDLYSLSVGKVVVERLELSGVRFDQKRASPGNVPDIGAEKDSDQPPALPQETPEKTVEKLDKYLNTAEEIIDWLKKLSKWFPKRDGEPPELEEKAPETYLGYLNARASVPPSARLLVKKIVVEGVEIPVPQFGTCNVEITNMSDAPYAAALPLTITFKSQEKGSLLRMLSHFEAPENGTDIEGMLEDIDLGAFQKQLSGGSGVLFKDGTAKAVVKGTASRRFIDLGLSAEVSGLQADTKEGKGVLGLDAATSSEVLAVVKDLKTTLQLTGPIAEPRVVIDTGGMRKLLQDRLVEAGKQRLIKELEKQAGDLIPDSVGEKLKEAVPDEIKETLPDAIKKPLEKPAKGIMDGVKGILGGDK